MSKIVIIDGNTDDKNNEKIYMVKGEKGEKGDTGPIGDNQLTIGTVTSGETASAEIVGTSPNQTLNLVLPKGDKGDTGEQGEPGQIAYSDVVDNLITVAISLPLSANQGRILKGLIDKIKVTEATGTWDGTSSFDVTYPTGYTPTNSFVIGIYMGSNHSKITKEGNYRYFANRWYPIENNTKIRVDVEIMESPGNYQSGLSRTVYVAFLRYKE